MPQKEKFSEREPRFKYVRLGASAILNLMGGWREHEFLQLPTFADLPEGCVVADVFFDWPEQSFVFRIYHEDFPLVEGGIQPEYVSGRLEAIRFKGGVDFAAC